MRFVIPVLTFSLLMVASVRVGENVSPDTAIRPGT